VNVNLRLRELVREEGKCPLFFFNETMEKSVEYVK